MATGSESGDQKEAAYGTLTFDLFVEILCRLPVKVLMKLRCVCKSWNSLISDPKFAKEHLRFSRTLLNRHHLLLCRNDEDAIPGEQLIVWDCRLSSASTRTTTMSETQLIHPLGDSIGEIIDSCDGIICYFGEYFDSILVWNPSISKFKILPPLEKELRPDASYSYGFGYDRLTDSYKVVALCRYQFDKSDHVCKTQVMVHTLGTDTWRSIQTFPSALPGLPVNDSGKFVSGNINWLICTAPRYSWVIVSLDLGNESYQELLQPDLGGDVCNLTLGVLRDCLCILAHTDTFVIHVWLMKDYGNKESWTKLFAIRYNDGLLGLPIVDALAYARYMFEDDQLLLDFVHMVFVYNPRNGTVKVPEIQYIFNDWYDNRVYIESLISP